MGGGWGTGINFCTWYILVLIAKKKLSPVTGKVSFPVQLGHQITITCKANKVRNVKIGNESIDDNFGQALGLCIFKPPFSSRAYRFGKSTQIEHGRIR